MGATQWLPAFVLLVRGGAQDDDCLRERAIVVADCDWDAYGEANPDVARVYPRDEYRVHYLDFGRSEGRACEPRGGSADLEEACFYADQSRGTVGAVAAALRRWPPADCGGGDACAATEATDVVGRFWASSRVWRLLAAMTDLEGLTLLDVGCGDGSTGEIARRVYGLASFRGIERRNWGAGNGGRTMGKANSPWAETEWYDGPRLPADDGAYDVVTSMYVLHHVPVAEQADLVGELARASRTWVVVCEDLDADGFRLYNQEHADDSATDGYNFRDAAGWLAVFDAAGLDLVAMGPCFDADHPSHYFVLRKRPARAVAAAREAATTLESERVNFLTRMYAGFERGRDTARLPHVREAPASPRARRLLHLSTLEYGL